MKENNCDSLLLSHGIDQNHEVQRQGHEFCPYFHPFMQGIAGFTTDYFCLTPSYYKLQNSTICGTEFLCLPGISKPSSITKTVVLWSATVQYCTALYGGKPKEGSFSFIPVVCWFVSQLPCFLGFCVCYLLPFTDTLYKRDKTNS